MTTEFPTDKAWGFESRFPLGLSQVSDTGFELTHTMIYWPLDGGALAIDEGQATDLGSQPRILRALFAPYGRATSAYILHDHLWREAAPRGVMTYRQADLLLREAMESLDVDPVRRWVTYVAVRLASIFTRPGGWRDSTRDIPAIVLVTLLMLPLVLIAGIPTAVVLSILWVAGRVSKRFDHPRAPHWLSTPEPRSLPVSILERPNPLGSAKKAGALWALIPAALGAFVSIGVLSQTDVDSITAATAVISPQLVILGGAITTITGIVSGLVSARRTAAAVRPDVTPVDDPRANDGRQLVPVDETVVAIEENN